MAKKRKSKSNTTTWIVVGIWLLALGYFWMRQQLGLIQVAGVSIPFQKLEGASVRLGIKVKIINASALAARITGFTGFILSPSGSVISTVFMERPAVVNRFQEAQLDFGSVISGASVAAELWNVLQTGQMPDWKGYRIKGQLRVYGFPLPIETTLV